MAHLYMQHRVGDLVDVAPATRVGRPNSTGGRGYIVAKRSSSPTSVAAESFDVEYIIPKKKLSKNVDPDRLSTAIIETVARRRRPAPDDADDQPIQLSLLSPHLQASKRILSTVTPSPPKRAKSNLVTTSVLLDLNRQWSSKPKSKDNNADHPIIRYLKRPQQDPGYLRRNDAKAAGHPIPKKGSHMSTEEKNNLLMLRNALSGVINFKQFGVTQLIANAYGVSDRQIQRLDKKAGTTNLQRKTRSDAGSNLLTSTKLQPSGPIFGSNKVVDIL